MIFFKTRARKYLRRNACKCMVNKPWTHGEHTVNIRWTYGEQTLKNPEQILNKPWTKYHHHHHHLPVQGNHCHRHCQQPPYPIANSASITSEKAVFGYASIICSKIPSFIITAHPMQTHLLRGHCTTSTHPPPDTNSHPMLAHLLRDQHHNTTAHLWLKPLLWK